MGRPLLDDDEPLELPRTLGEDDEATGLADAEELMLAEIDEGPEDVGLDAETFSIEDFEAVDDLDEPTGREQDDLGSEELVAEVDAEGDENGWVEESEGSSEPFDEDDFLDEEDTDVDDGGQEGVDDPMLEGLSDDERPRLDDDEDDEDDLDTDVGEDLLREIAQDG